MTWRYEARSLNDINRLINECEHIHPQHSILKGISKKAYEVAKVFEAKGMNEEFIVKYLNDELPCDALCEYVLTASILHPTDIPIEERIHSYSHSEWLTSLNRTKLQWTWKQPDIELEITQRKKLQKILDSYNKLQKLALSYTYE